MRACAQIRGRFDRGLSPSSLSAFSLIELIGVLAIMAILASVLAPNAFRALDNAAIRAEATSLESLGSQTKLFLAKNGYLPGSKPTGAPPTWYADLASYSDLASADVLTNKRLVQRLFVVDPAGGQRVMILSSMNSRLALPTAGTVSSNFNLIWNNQFWTPPPNVVSGIFPAVWRTPAADTATNFGFFVIQRVNLQQVFTTDLQSLSVTINNSDPTSTGVSYIFTPYGQSSQPRVTVLANATSATITVHPRDRLDLYKDTSSTTPSYTQIFSTGNTNPTTFTWSAPASAPTALSWKPQ